MTNSHEQASAMGPETPPPYAGPSTPPPGPGPVPPAWSGRYGNAPKSKSPALAGVLSGFMPGLGQIYLGSYQRGFVHAAIFAGLVACLSSGAAHGLEPLFGIMLGFFYFYNIVDAARRATLYNVALQGGQIPVPEDFKMPTGRSSLLGGVMLTAIGVMLLLNTRFDYSLDWLADWWPAFIVVIGATMVYRAVRERQKT